MAVDRICGPGYQDRDHVVFRRAKDNKLSFRRLMMSARWARTTRWSALGAGAVLAVVASAAAIHRMDVEKFRGYPERMTKLQEACLRSDDFSAFLTGGWPQWRGPNRDGVSRETGLLTEWPSEGPPLCWQQNLGRGFSAPVVAHNRVYTLSASTPTDEVVACWDAATGRSLWRFAYPNQYEERMGSGPRSTPAVDGDRIYTVGPTGILHCLRAGTGELVWRHDLLDEFHAPRPQYGVAFSPLIDGDVVYVLPGGEKGNSVAAFDKYTGRLVWQALEDPVGYSSPILVTAAGVRQLLVLTNMALVSLSPRDGAVLWRYPWVTPNGFNIATPIALDNYVFLSSGYGKGCTLLEIGTNPAGSLAARPVYEHNRMRNYFSSSVCYRGYLYGFDNSDLVCMDVRTGKTLWREKGIRSFKKGSLLISDGHLIILSEYGKLHLAEATPEGYREKAHFQVSENKCWTVPILAAGRLYVRDESCLRCFDLRGPSTRSLAAND
jgi:outer membrane protein assembly factor BamB